MSVTWDEKVLWPGLQSLYLGLTQNREGIEWYIAWYFVYRIAFVLPIVYLTDWQYLQIVINLTFALSSMLIIVSWNSSPVCSFAVTAGLRKCLITEDKEEPERNISSISSLSSSALSANCLVSFITISASLS